MFTDTAIYNQFKNTFYFLLLRPIVEELEATVSTRPEAEICISSRLEHEPELIKKIIQIRFEAHFNLNQI